MKTLLVLIFLHLLFFVSSLPAFACSCIGPTTPVDALKSASAVFSGKVIDKAPSRRRSKELDPLPPNYYQPDQYDSSGSTIFTFEVEEAFKGIKERKVQIETTTVCCMCGFNFKVGESYLVFAYGSSPDSLSTGICTGTDWLSNSKDEISLLRAINGKYFETRVFGKVVKTGMAINGSFMSTTDDVPLQGVKLVLEGKAQRLETTTDAEGEYRFVNVPYGEYKIHLALDSKYKIWLGENEDFTLMLDEKRINSNMRYRVELNAPLHGTVYDDSGKSVGKSVFVTVISVEDGKPKFETKHSAQVSTKKDGTYAFNGLPPGKYVLGVNVLEAASPSAPFPSFFYPRTTNLSDATVLEIIEGEQRTLDLKMFPSLKPRIIRGIVTLDGKPESGVTLNLASKDAPQRSIHGLTAESNLEGEFSVSGFEGQEYAITGYKYANSESYRVSPVPIQGTSGKATVALDLVKQQKEK